MKLRRVRFCSEDLRELSVNLEGIDTKLNGTKEVNPSWTWKDSNGDILASAGMIPIWTGLGETWAIFSPTTKYHPLRRELVRDFKNLHLSMVPILKYRRLQSLVVESFRDGHALMLLLGYKLESIMPSYGPNGETFYRYVWFTKDNIK